MDGWMVGWLDGWMDGCVDAWSGMKAIYSIYILVGCTVEMYSEEKACTIRPIATAYRGGELMYNTGHQGWRKMQNGEQDAGSIFLSTIPRDIFRGTKYNPQHNSI